jgi:hypothetical protein
MSKASKTTASETIEVEGYEGHLQNMNGYTAAFEKYTADTDLSPFLKGLPDDRCQCPHWGLVIEGQVRFKNSTGEETFEAGDAFYVAPGHTPVFYAGTELLMFSPSEELRRTSEVVGRNMEAAGD